MADQPSPRRLFQFSLRTLMIVVTLLAVVCGYVGWQAKIVRNRKLVMNWIATHNGETALNRKHSGAPDYWPSIPWLRRLLGDRAIAGLNIGPLSAEDEARIREAFPEMEDIKIE
jgi:hypothetical protein